MHSAWPWDTRQGHNRGCLQISRFQPNVQKESLEVHVVSSDMWAAVRVGCVYPPRLT